MTATSSPPRMSRLADADLAKMLLIRQFELAMLDLFDAGKLNGTTHTCLGQEHIPVAVAPLLDDGDIVLSNHRGHGHYLSRFADPEGLLAEIMGREGAICAGVGGSQHIYRTGYLSTGVQGESLPLSVGMALTAKRACRGTLVAVYVGDGTWGEGAVYEALNLAQLWRLPIAVLVEHNRIAQSTPTTAAMAGTIAGRARAFGLPHLLVEDIDLTAIRDRLRPVFSQVREDHQPVVVEFATHRLGPHSKGDDTRPAGEIALARENDWAAVYAREHPDQFRAADEQQRRRVEAIVRAVEARPPSRWEPGR